MCPIIAERLHLNLAQNTAIDARIKTDITHRQYCGLAAAEYLSYLLADTGRWDAWLTANPDDSDPSGSTFTEVLDVCGRNITISAVQQPVQPPGDVNDGLESPTVIPALAAYNKRVLQARKTVSDSNPTGGDSVEYTVKIANHDDKKNSLKEITDTLPPGFTYDCSASADQLTLPGESAQDIIPDDRDDADFCSESDGFEITWDIPGNPDLLAGEVVTLTFNAVTSSDFGTYCNGVEATPDGFDNRSGATALVQIGSTPGLCPDQAAVVTKEWKSIVLTATDTSTSPRTYTFDVNFEISLANIGSEDLEVTELMDLLPQGFEFGAMDFSGDITESPWKVQTQNKVSREEVTWRFNPNIMLASGTTKTVKFSTTAILTRGDYRSDVLADFAGGSFPRDKYTWPTALIEVRDVFNVSASDSEGGSVSGLNVIVSDEAGEVNTWSLE
jgi:fimbrial isopeptide formation D2 family protein